MGTNTQAGQRLRAIRDLTGLTREEFCDVTGFKYLRLQNVELLKAKLNEDDFLIIGEKLPSLLPWLAYGGDIDIDALKSSDNEMAQIIAAKLSTGNHPSILLDEKIKNGR